MQPRNGPILCTAHWCGVRGPVCRFLLGPRTPNPRFIRGSQEKEEVFARNDALLLAQWIDAHSRPQRGYCTECWGDPVRPWCGFHLLFHSAPVVSFLCRLLPRRLIFHTAAAVASMRHLSQLTCSHAATHLNSLRKHVSLGHPQLEAISSQCPDHC